MPIDIGALLESHRAYVLATVSEQDYESEQELANARHAISVVHDRATTKTLLDLYRQGLAPNGEVRPTGQASATPAPTAAPQKSRAIKPGSKRAKDRAAKALETKRRKAEGAAGGAPTAPADEAPLSPATHLAPRSEVQP